MDFIKQLDIKTKEITDLLKSKNKAYGNSALEPANIFSEADAIDSLCARIDDKLMRIKNKGEYNLFKDAIDEGGHANINGSPISTIEELNNKLKIDKSN